MKRCKWICLFMVIVLTVPIILMGSVPAIADVATSKVKMSSFKLTADASYTVNIGDTFRIDLAGKTAKRYKSSEPKVATVSSKGVVKAVKAGKATITVTLTNKKKLKLKLTVIDPTMPTILRLNRTGTITIDKRETLRLKAILYPKTAVSSVTWKSSNKKIATVKNGVVTPVKVGKVTITATSKRGKKSAKVDVVIKDKHAPTSVRINQGNKISMTVNSKLKLTTTATAELMPAITTYTWRSSNESVAAVSKSGVVTAKMTGKEESDVPACRDYEEFFRRTRRRTAEMDEKILRYVEKVTVWGEKVEIELKGNVKVAIED